MTADSFEQKCAAVLKSMEQDRQKLLLRQPFIGMILMNLELVPAPGNIVKTACTDGSRIMMGIPFYAKLDLEERLFVLAHEAWHCVLMHGVRCQTRNHRQFNIAADLEIHFILQKEKMKEPFVLPHKLEWDGLSAEEIYEQLGHKNPRKHHVTEIQANKMHGNTPGLGDRGSKPGQESEHIHCDENGEGFDQHVYAEGGTRTHATDQEKADAHGADKQRYGTESGDSGREGKNSDTFPEAVWDTETIERIRRMVIRAAQIVERTQGHLHAHLQGIVEKLRKPELPWRELLRQFVTSCYGGSRRWLPPARRYLSRQLYLPSFRDNRMNAVLAIDSSGSTTCDLPQFFAELSSLLNSFGKYELTVIYCDCIIQHVEKFTDARRFPRSYEWKSYGGGGTSFIPPFEYVREHALKPEIFIYLTDGCGNAPAKAPKYPVLWVLTNDGRKCAKWGRVIKLKNGRKDVMEER
ncbi:MAG: VWA-like domain-containing protein [Lentisphaeria bacterium]